MIIIAFCADTFSQLGRVDKSEFSQQTLMELFLDKVTNKGLICGNAENPSEISEWVGVFPSLVGVVVWGIRLNSEKQVEKVELQQTTITGSVQLEWLPNSVKICKLGINRLVGTICLDKLPPVLEILDVSHNKLSGNLNLEHLPNTLKTIRAAHNSFTGTLNLTRLPEHLEVLAAESNMLTGNIDLTNLPDSIQHLNLSRNKVSGESDFTALPDALKELNVRETDLSGKVRRQKGKKFEIDGSKVKLI